jgi:glycerol-3-phosphate acyltransferase PlsX
MIKIAIDAFGGDNAPRAVVEGAIEALLDYDDIEMILCGREDAIREELRVRKYDERRLHVINATEVIDCHEQPTLAIKKKKDSSLVRALQLVANKEADCIVSAGSTGALLTGATLIIRRIKGVKRPALAPLLPTKKGGWVMLIDCGANTDCKPSYLQQFGVMADAYMRHAMNLDQPRIALLNNGEEAEKGNELTKVAYQFLKAAPISFAGNCEAREILSGDIDALVCDGFVGNVVLKYTEGLSDVIFSMLKTELKADKRSMLGAALAKPAFKRMKKKMDYKEVGGAPLLGIDGCVIKAHGSSDGKAFRSAIMQARSFAKSGVNGALADAIAALPEMED